MIRLSENFTLDEMIVSQEATRRGIRNDPPSEAVEQLGRLCTYILQPIRDAYQMPVVVSSGYRSETVNRLVGGSRTSLHLEGRAADFTIPGIDVAHICRRIDTLRLPFDELIYEGAWVHVGVAKDIRTPRRKIMTARFSRSGVQYLQGIVDGT